MKVTEPLRRATSEAVTHDRHRPLERCVGVERGRVDRHGIICRAKRGHGAVRVLRITVTDLGEHLVRVGLDAAAASFLPATARAAAADALNAWAAGQGLAPRRPEAA